MCLRLLFILILILILILIFYFILSFDFVLVRCTYLCFILVFSFFDLIF